MAHLFPSPWPINRIAVHIAIRTPARVGRAGYDCEDRGMTEPRAAALADEVRDELMAVGLPVLPDRQYPDEDSSGAEIHAYDDGVWVGWHVGRALSEASSRALRLGAFEQRPDGFEMHPALRHAGGAEEALSGAIATVLRSAGYPVEEGINDYSPFSLRVSPRPAGPHWRDPVGPPLAGRSGFSPGARVRLLAGEHAGAVVEVVTVRFEDRKPASYRIGHPSGEGYLDVPPEAVTMADL
jgi:hypothetical protein